MKKFCLILILTIIATNAVKAKDIPVQIKPSHKISTSDRSLKEGEFIDLVIAQDIYLNSTLFIKSGEKVVGVITALKDNEAMCEVASIYAENFVVNDENGKKVKLSGVLYKKGRDHALFTQFLPIFYQFIRGGEVQIQPEKDFFTLYLEAK